MERRRYFCALAGVFLLSGGAVFSAQTQDQRPPHRERIRENIHRLRLLRMTEALDLSEEQTAKIYPFASRIEKDKQALLKEIEGEMRRLEDLVGEADTDETQLLASVARIKEMRQKFQQKDREFEDFLEENLNSLQKAKYLLFSAEFYRGITEGLRRRWPQRQNERPT